MIWSCLLTKMDSNERNDFQQLLLKCTRTLLQKCLKSGHLRSTDVPRGGAKWTCGQVVRSVGLIFARPRHERLLCRRSHPRSSGRLASTVHTASMSKLHAGAVAAYEARGIEILASVHPMPSQEKQPTVAPERRDAHITRHLDDGDIGCRPPTLSRRRLI